ncbi:hypothetical protein ACFWIJ_29510 [Streptomyces sp. NPDC127079]|uniref:hypothetical protein n=1 Tax=Streptomyces sp. NPDC127079 TaxID=3347132 RepID=UPI003656D629
MRSRKLQHRARGWGHGLREIRRLKVCTVQPGLLFPHALETIEVTSLAPEQAAPERIAEPSGDTGRSRHCTT